ncbi:MAG: peptidylprolyl isomerase [Ruminococcus sp.]|nr:peptidylprolyl isomerase [Candidatus Copronaster equi]
MKKVFSVLICLSMIIVLFAGCGDKKETADTDTTKADTAKHHVEIVVKDYGTIKLELDPSQAPITVENFLSLVKSGFYNGLTFHRIMDGFMIQGGDPKGDGTGGSDKEIKGEFSMNGVNNTISHTRGTVSMARANNPDSGSSQFFICQADSTFLDGQYAGFGHVTEGMDVVDKISKQAKPIDNNGTIPKSEQPVIEKITVID